MINCLNNDFELYFHFLIYDSFLLIETWCCVYRFCLWCNRFKARGQE